MTVIRKRVISVARGLRGAIRGFQVSLAVHDVHRTRLLCYTLSLSRHRIRSRQLPTPELDASSTHLHLQPVRLHRKSGSIVV